MSNNTEFTVREIPPEISKRLSTWRGLYLAHLYSHYSLGICGVVASALAGFQLPAPMQQVCAGMATISIAIVGFIRPERKYQKYVQAWRILDVTATRYRYSQAEISDLLTALDDSERHISDYDRVNDSVDSSNRQKGQQPQKNDKPRDDRSHDGASGSRNQNNDEHRRDRDRERDDRSADGHASEAQSADNG
jgi:hypothetical protein